MILLIGHGYMGTALAEEMTRRGIEFTHAHHYDHPRVRGFHLVINAAAYVPLPSVNLCGKHPAETIAGNISLPAQLAIQCADASVGFIHISTGCLFDEAREYTELDKPIRGWDDYCGFYVGTKLEAERIVSAYKNAYILRVRLPFDEFANPRNYISKIANYPNVFDHINSLTHRADFAKATLDLWEARAPFGVYHVANEGQVSARWVIAEMMKRGLVQNEPEYVPGPCPGCRLSVEKLLATGVKMRTVHEAVIESLDNWKRDV